MAIQALVVFTLLNVGFRLFGFPRVFLFLDRWNGHPAHAASRMAHRRRIRLAVEAVRTATRYYCRRRKDCLPQALTLFVLLRRRGVPATLRIGVKRYPFAAHAWVECLGEVLDDSTHDWQHEAYVPILTSGDSA